MIGCECSGRVRDAFAALGWEAWSADLLPSETPSTRHYQGDVRDLFKWGHPVNRQRWKDCRGPLYELPIWDLFIGHPPCDHISYAGARWFKIKQADGRQQAALDFFGDMIEAPSPLVAVENPHSLAQTVYGKPTQIVSPWMFGDPYEKGIHLWLKGLPVLEADKVVVPTGRVTTGGGSWRTDKAAGRKAMSAYEDSEGRANRSRVRSRTFPGLAKSMAQQWDRFARDYYRVG